MLEQAGRQPAALSSPHQESRFFKGILRRQVASRDRLTVAPCVAAPMCELLRSPFGGKNCGVSGEGKAYPRQGGEVSGRRIDSLLHLKHH
jgi:hypothetical protein